METRRIDAGAFELRWPCRDGRRLVLLANLADEPVMLEAAPPGGELVFSTGDAAPGRRLAAWSASWLIVGS